MAMDGRRTARRRAAMHSGVVALVAVLTTALPLAPPAAADVPPAPATLEVRPTIVAGLDIRWSPAAEATDYEIEVRRADGESMGTRVVIGSQHTFGGLEVGSLYTATIRARSAAGYSSEVTSPEVAVVADGPAAPVADVTAVQEPGSTRLRVSWTRQTEGLVAYYYALRVNQWTAPVLYDSCVEPCATKVLEGLKPGTYTVEVLATNFYPGSAWVSMAGEVTVTSGCEGGEVCVNVDAAGNRGPALGAANGVSHSIGGVSPALVDPLNLRHARVSQFDDLAAAMAQDADITYVVSDAWYQATGTGTGAAKPWDNWTRYDTWLRRLVAMAKATGLPVDWWEIQNEPYGGYFTPLEWYPYTADQLNQHFLHAYRTIKSVDPAAKVLGPTFDKFDANKFRNFLDFAVANDLRFDGYVWHALVARPGEGPDRLGANVAEARRLVAERPTLGDPALLITEYQSPASMRLPGFAAAWISAIEAADIDAAARTCLNDDSCFGPTLGELIDVPSQQPRGGWWVHKFYGEQTGVRLPVTTSRSDVYAFATRDADTVRVLAGRAETCHAAVNKDCAAGPWAPTPPFDAPVTIVGGWAPDAQVRVTVERVPAGAVGPLEAPWASSDTVVTATDGTVQVTLPSVVDGDAWTVVATPAG
jgi:PKD repeat protein